MPELPEVETVRLQLLHAIKGKTILAVEVFHNKATNHDARFVKLLTGKTFTHIDRIGKLLIFSFTSEPDFFVLAHLKMTGQFFFTEASSLSGGGHSMTVSDVRELPGKHTRIAFTCTDDTKLYFNDMRLFGYMKIATANMVAIARARFGQEPIQADFDLETFTKRLKKRRTSIKAALLDQSFIAGLGNIYVDEALFAAGVRPTRLANKLTKAEVEKVVSASRDILTHSIKVGGTTFQHFLDVEGKVGNYTNYLQVFGKQNTPCPGCGADIIKIRVAGRGTHYCKVCQK